MHPPIAFMRKEAGGMAAGAEQLDEVFATRWDDYYNRPVDAEEVVVNFAQRYSGHVHLAPEAKLQPVSGADLRRALDCWAPTAAGLDGMAPEDAKHFSDGALRWVARLLCCVEHGAEWPTCCREVKLVPAAKPGEDHTRPEGYRLLAVLAWLYRAWGKARLHAMADWIAGWAPDGFYTCVKSRGAADAWLRRAAELEKAKVCGGTFTGGSVDVEKCYDMLLRPLAYYLAAAAGMDRAVLTAYIRFQEAARYTISNAPGYGSFRGHIRGLPQGCPFSQIMLGLHALAWYRLTLQAEAVPRALADDLSFAADT